MKLLPSSGRRLPSVLAAGAALLLVACAARADVKIVSEVNVTGLPPQAQAQVKQTFPQTVMTYYKGDMTRTELAGSVVLYDCLGDKLYTLDPAKKTYTIASVQEMMEKAGPLMAMMKFDTTADVKEGGASKTIAGKPAKNFLFTANIALSMEGTPAGMLPTTKIVGEQWVTNAVALPANCQRMMAASLARSAGPMLGGMKPLIEKMATMKGAPLSSKVTVTITAAQPLPGLPTDPIVTTTEVKAISEEALDDALFKIPADYKKVEPTPAPPGPGTSVGQR